MIEAQLVLLGTAASVASLHTLVGVDHYLPFVMIGRARLWSIRRTLAVTALCGVGHVLGSVVLGAAGIAAGAAIESLQWVETLRGNLAAWLLIGFGLAYAAWAFVRGRRRRRHAHAHVHEDGLTHCHDHGHEGRHTHVHAPDERAGSATVWTLFIIFVFGPCEPLIPLLMVPAADRDWAGVAAVAFVFGGVTIAAMLSLVAIGLQGISLARVRSLGRHANVVAGLAIAASGLAIRVLGI